MLFLPLSGLATSSFMVIYLALSNEALAPPGSMRKCAGRYLTAFQLSSYYKTLTDFDKYSEINCKSLVFFIGNFQLLEFLRHFVGGLSKGTGSTKNSHKKLL
jgi:hypothetical protein